MCNSAKLPMVSVKALSESEFVAQTGLHVDALLFCGVFSSVLGSLDAKVSKQASFGAENAKRPD